MTTKINKLRGGLCLVIIAFLIVATVKGMLQNVTLIMSGGTTFKVGDARELNASYKGRPQRVTWKTAQTTIVALSYPRSLHYRSPGPGQPYISHVIQVECKKKGTANITAEPLNTAIGASSVTVNCVDKGGMLPGNNNEPYTFGWENQISQRAKDDFNLPDQCAVGQNLASIVYADRTGCSIRADGGRCTQCHKPGRMLANINFVGMSKQNFCTVIQDFINNTRNPQNLRNFFQDWVSRGCPD